MGDPRGFLLHDRKLPEHRPVPVRLKDWREVYEPFAEVDLQDQASRCMDCGIPFCNNGCPLGNLIPDWNDLVYRGDWRRAIDALHATNNFPEFTGRLCPAPCEAACVAGINTEAVTIKNIEVTIINRAWEEGWVTPIIASKKTGKRVAVVGSGPAGLAAAQQLTRAGHDVVVLERADRIGGLLRYGIPEFKMEKAVLDRRLEQMVAEGTQFRTNCHVGSEPEHPDHVSVEGLRAEFDAIVLAGGSTVPNDFVANAPGRELDGIHQAMDYLPPANRVQEGDLEAPPISAEGKSVVILGGGDTGADCLGTANRQGATIVHQFEIMPRPPDERSDQNPWPTWPTIMRTASAHEEGVERRFSVNTTEFVASDGRVTHIRGHEVAWVTSDGGSRPEQIEGSEFELEADLVLLAMGFSRPEHSIVGALGIQTDDRGNVVRDSAWTTSCEGVFACGDMGRGQSLIVWAIAEGRSCAAAVDAALMGSTLLPAPIRPSDRPLT